MTMRKVVYGAVWYCCLFWPFWQDAGTPSRNPAEVASPGRRILYYVDPMNPAHTSDKPGIAPCGMKMEPVYADEGSPGQAPAAPPHRCRPAR